METTDALFALIRSALEGQATDPLPADVDWRALYALSVLKGVGALCYPAAARIGGVGAPPREVLLRWAAHADRTENEAAMRRRALGSLAGWLGERGFKVMVLKGVGLEALYPAPGQRPYGDLDLWLYGRQKEADALLRREGVAVSDAVHHHSVSRWEGITVENHSELLNASAHPSNRLLEEHLRRLSLAERITTTVEEAAVDLPSASFNALFLMRHMAGHFAAAGIGVREVVDWALFLRNAGDAFDPASFWSWCRRLNMHRFAAAVSGIVHERLGVPWIAGLAETERDRALEQRVLEEILRPAPVQPRRLTAILRFKLRRFLDARWKYALVYREPWPLTFVRSVWGHLRKPATLRH